MNPAKNFKDAFVSVIEDVCKLFADDRTVHEVADKTERQFVMYDIRHFHTARYFPEMMLMVPKTIWATALFVDEIDPLFYLNDLRHPIDPKPGKRPQPVFDDLAAVNAAGIHVAGSRVARRNAATVVPGPNPELHIWGCK